MDFGKCDQNLKYHSKTCFKFVVKEEIRTELYLVTLIPELIEYPRNGLNFSSKLSYLIFKSLVSRGVSCHLVWATGLSKTDAC